MAKPSVILYVDIVSPFAYLAFHILKNSPAFKECDVSYVPIFLGGVMKACGNTPPIAIKNKNKWIDLDRRRWAQKFGIPMAETVPDGFPAMTLSVQRILAAISMHHPTSLVDAIAALYHAYWVQRRPITSQEVVAAVLGDVFKDQQGVVAEIMEKSASTEVKESLTANTEKVLKDGCFGLPWFEATDQAGQTAYFWGFDHLGLVVDFLGLQGPRTAGAAGAAGGWDGKAGSGGGGGGGSGGGAADAGREGEEKRAWRSLL